MCLEARVPDEQKDHIFDTVYPHLRYIVGTAGVNPREVKRYINAYILLIKMRPYLRADAVLALQTIAFQPEWQIVQRMVLTYQELFVDAIRRFTDGIVSALEFLDVTAGALPTGFIQYIQPNSPGHALLEVGNVKEYIFSGEFTRSNQDSRLLEVIRALAQLKPKLRELSTNPEPSNQAQEIVAEISSITARLETIAKRQGGIVETVNLLRTLESNISIDRSTLTSDWGRDERREWNVAQDRLLQQAISSLLNFYQFSSI